MLWYKDQQPIGLDDSDKRVTVEYNSKSGDASLQIEKSSVDDSGKYSVHAENSKGLIIVTVDVVIADDISEIIFEEHHAEQRQGAGEERTRVTSKKTSRIGEAKELSVEEIIERELSSAKSMAEEGFGITLTDDVVPGKSARLDLAPEPQCVNVGETIRLTCKVSGML